MTSGFQLGDLIGEYRVHDTVANGYHAFHLVDARGVLIRVWPVEDDEAVSDSIARATHVLNAFEHPGIAHFVECGVLPDGRRWTAFETPDGLSLQDAIARRALRADEIASLIRDVADVLTYAHERRVVHGNLRLHNIVLTNREYPVSVGDWGRMIDDPATTREFLAPEESLDTHGDIYALGVIAYHALTGRAPRGAVRTIPGVPPALGQLMIRMMEFDPQARPTAGEVLGTITHMLGGDPPAEPATDPEATIEEVIGDVLGPDLLGPVDDEVDAVIFEPPTRRVKWTPATHLVTKRGIGEPTRASTKRPGDDVE